MSDQGIINRFLAELPEGIQDDLKQTVELEFRDELRIIREWGETRSLDTPITLSFEQTGLSAPLTTKSNLFLILCLNFEGAGRMSWGWGLDEVLGTTGGDVYKIEEHGLDRMAEIFAYLQYVFNTTTPEVPRDPAVYGELAKQWGEYFADAVPYTYLNQRQADTNRPARAVPDHLQSDKLMSIPLIAAKHLIEALTDNLATQNTDASVRFSRYGNVMEAIDLNDLTQDTDCIARAEESGAEGVFVEVVKWDDTEGWYRYAFCKLFSQSEAQRLTDRINANSGYAPIFHRFPDKKPAPTTHA